MTSSWIYRAGLALLLAAAVAAPGAIASWERSAQPIDAQIKIMLNAQNARILREYPLGSEGEAVEAALPACGRPVTIVVAPSALEDQSIFDGAVAREGAAEFVYLGKTYARLDHVGLWLDYLSALSSNLFRARPLANLDQIVAVENPARCAAAASIDWFQIWNPAEVKSPATAPPSNVAPSSLGGGNGDSPAIISQ